MSGKVESLVNDWFKKHYPDLWYSWIDPNFNDCEELPVELAMVPAFRFLEHNLINGGWPQFLWNGFGNWRYLLKVTQAGSRIVGAAPFVFHAMSGLYTLCYENEAECERDLSNEDSRFGLFIEKMNLKYDSEQTNWEMVLYSGTKSYWKRLTWLDKNEEFIQTLLETSAPPMKQRSVFKDVT